MSDWLSRQPDWVTGGNMITDALGVSAEDETAPAAAASESPTITGENSVEAQSAQRRLARLSRYFTTPTGIMDSATGSQGVF